jgi:hypothetical protein
MRKQQGFTFWSLVFTVCGVFFAALIVMKLFPPYVEFFAVKKAINKIANEGNLSAENKREIQLAFERSSDMDDIKSIKPTELQITRSSSGETVVTAEYEVIVPLIANVSALLTFRASTDDKLAKASKNMP